MGPDCVDNDVLYREGFTLDKQATYTPRLVAIDLKGNQVFLIDGCRYLFPHPLLFRLVYFTKFFEYHTMAFSFLCFSTMFICYFAGNQVVKTAIYFLKTSVASIFCLFVSYK